MNKLFSLAFVFAGSILAALTYGQATDPPSPFQTPKVASEQPRQQAPEVASPLDTLEFNGVMKMGGVISISVYDTKERRNYWLEEGEATEGGLRVVRYKPESDVVVVSSGGVSRSLSIKKAKIEPLNIAASAVSQPTPNQPVVTNATSRVTEGSESDEDVRKRMQKVAEEIRRRRAERRARIEENRNNR